MASAMGAGAGADMLQDILRRKFAEAIALQQQAHARAALTEQARQANMQHSLGRDRLGETQRQFDALEPTRIAGLAHTEAQTGEIKRRPQAEIDARTHQSTEAEKGRTFTGQQGDLNRQNAVRIAGMQGQTALKVAQVRHPDATAAATDAAAKTEQNEVEDSLARIKRIREDKARPIATGPIQGRGFGAFADLEGYTRVKQLHDNLVNRMQLAQAGKLKGQGAISNMEREMLAKAATALDRKLGDPDYLTELANVEQQFQRMLTGPRVANAPGGGGAPAQETPEQRIKRLLAGG